MMEKTIPVRTRIFVTALCALAEAATGLQTKLDDPDYSADYDTSEVDKFDNVLEAVLEARNGYCKAERLAIEDANIHYTESEVQRDNEKEDEEDGEEE